MRLARVFPFLAALVALWTPARVAAQSGSVATFLRSDTTTAGNWHGAYGADGYSVAEDAQNLPGYALFSLQNQQDYTWQASTADRRALQTGSGLERIAAAWYSPSSFGLNVNLADGNTHQVALYAIDWDNQGRSETVQIIDATTSAILDTETLSNFSNGTYLVWNITGNVIITVTQNSGANAVLSGIFFGGSSTITAAAHFVSSDVTTQGNWQGAYGAEGYSLANDTQSVPAYASFAPQNQSNYTWASSSADTRALQTGNGLGRIAATWYSSSDFDLDVNLTDANTHQVSLYAVDWDLLGRFEVIQILDAATDAVLDTENLSTFTNGEYLVWNISGHVKINVIQTAGANAVVSGVFFGGSGTVSSSASFVRSDTTTQGNWHGAYGADGYSVATDSQSLPSYASFAPLNASTYIWSSDPSQISAPQTGSGSGRIAATWYGNPAFSFDVNITDGNSHQVALYALDFDSLGRSEVIQVLDAATDALLDTRTVSAFSGGTYLIWNLSGHVTVNVLSAAGPNAVISAIFFGGSSTITSTAMFVHSDAATLGVWPGTYGADGYSVASATQSLPSYVTFALENQSNWVWDPNPSDPRALETGTGSGLIAATWYNNPSFSLDVNISDGHAHQFSLYTVDWDSQGRSEAVQILDAATEAVLDTETLSTFTSGVYLVWTISGHVRINIIDITGPNAVVSGVFFDPPPSSGSGGSPTIASLSAYSGGVGAPITITGTNFGSTQGSSTVNFNGIAAAPTNWSDTQIIVPVPTGATTGNIVVTVGGTASNGIAFTVVTTPVISALNPTFGGPGATVAVTGSNFGATQGSSTVTLNGTAQATSSWSDLTITFVVPSAALTGPVVVTVGGDASNAVTLSVVPTPEITNLSPAQGLAGTSVTVTGSNFGSSQGSSVVTFNGVAATPSSWSNTAITVPVPTGTTTGPVAVTVASVPSNGLVFTVTGPTIAGLSTHVAAIGDSITIYGAGFGVSQGSNTISFSGVPATATSWNGMTIVVPVPAGATSGLIQVMVAGVASNSASFAVSPADTITGISISNPSDGSTATTPYVAVTGTITGSISGVDPVVVVCNTVTAQLIGTNFSCNPPLTTGVNPITVTGTDSAGDTSSATINITLGMTTPVSLTVTPGPANMLVNQTQAFTAVDDQGMKRPDATWTVSDSTIANIVTGSPNTLMADAAGQVTLTATVSGVSGQTTVTVLPGTSLPIGTVLWSATPSGCAAQQTVQAAPTADGPDLYSVETCPDGSTLIRAFTSDGEQLWQTPLSRFAPAGLTVLTAVGDNLGGLLIEGVADQSYLFDLGAEGNLMWQYSPAPVGSSIPALDSNIAVGLVGTIFVVEHGCTVSGGSKDCLNSLGPQTGTLVNQINLPTSTSIDTNDNFCDEPNLSTRMSTFSGPSSAPMVAPDGSLFSAVGTTNSSLYEVCDRSTGVPNATSQSSGVIKLVRVLPDGGTQLQQIDGSSTQNQSFTPDADIPNEVIPDGNGGVLATFGGYNQQMQVSDVGSGGGGAATIPNVFMGGVPNPTAMVLGDNSIAFGTDGGSVVAFSTATLQPLWTYTSTGGSLSLLVATSGGGVTINDSLQGVIQLDSSGNAGTPVASLQGAAPFLPGLPLSTADDGTTTGIWTNINSQQLSDSVGPNAGMANSVFPGQSGGGTRDQQSSGTVAPAGGGTELINIRGFYPPSSSNALTSGDNLHFGIGQTCPPDPLNPTAPIVPGGPLSCNFIRTWAWNVEVLGTVSDDASNWTPRQTYREEWSGNYIDGSGNLHPLPFNHQPFPNNPKDPDVPDGPTFYQNLRGTHMVFFLDEPGPHQYWTIDGVLQKVDSINVIQDFSISLCNRAGCPARQDWFVNTIVNNGSVLDVTNSTANYGHKTLP
jgi:IPT/TIG domain